MSIIFFCFDLIFDQKIAKKLTTVDDYLTEISGQDM